MTLSEEIARFASSLEFDDIPEDVRAKVKCLLLDTLGTAIAAIGTQWGATAIGMAADGGGPAESTVIGGAGRVGVANAVLANGCLAHALDFDDTYFGAIVHPSCVVVPAALGMAEAQGRSGRDLVTAAAASYEVLLRVARAGQDNLFRENYHTTGLMGPMGAAVAGARLLGLDAERTAHALAIAAGLGGGILQSMREGQHVKALQAGYAAHGGVLAALLAGRGVPGPRRSFEGELGFYATYLSPGQFDLARLTEDLGAQWFALDISPKMYPGAHRHHFFVESALVLAREHGIDNARIEEICCVSSPTLHYYNFTPTGYRPPNAHVARFSVPFLVASALVGGGLGVHSFSEAAIADERILGLAAKVTYRVEEGAERPENRGRVEIRLSDGRVLENVQRYIRGLPENPATEADMRAKFAANAGTVLGEGQADRLADRVMRMEDIAKAGSLLADMEWGRGS